MVPPEAGERHTIGLAFALIIAQPKKRGKHARQIGCVEAASGKPKIPHSQSLPLEGKAQAVEKVEHSWAFSHLYGKISMGDERCLNEGSWIVES